MPTERRILVVAAAAAAAAAGTKRGATEDGAQSNSAATPTALYAKNKKKRKPGIEAVEKNHDDEFVIDLSDVPPQPLILKNELSRTNYRDNSRRRPVKEGISSKYTGVYYVKNGKWKAQIMAGGRVRHLGYCDTEEEAAAVYARSAFKYKSTAGGRMMYGGLDLSDVPERPFILNKASASGYRGVKKLRDRWQARIGGADGRYVTLGTFDSPEEAAGIYARALYLLERGGKGRAAGAGSQDGSRVGMPPPTTAGITKDGDSDPAEVTARGPQPQPPGEFAAV